MSQRTLQIWWSALAACAVAAAPARAYDASDRWEQTATNGFIGVNAWGTPTTVTWSIAPDGTQVPGNGGGPLSSNLISFLDANWGAGPGGGDLTQRPWFFIFSNSYARLSALSGVTYVYEPNDDGITSPFPRSFSNAQAAAGILGTRGDVRIGGKTFGEGSSTLAANFYPDYGEMMVNTDQASFLTMPGLNNDYRAFRNTLMHESMHGLGANHIISSTSRFLIEPVLGTSFDGPQLDDILALQRLYGDALEKNGGNDGSAKATALGALGTSQAIKRGTLGDNAVVEAMDVDFLSIDGLTDVDYFSFTTTETFDVSLLLEPKGTAYSIRKESEDLERSYDSRALNDLSLALFDSTGTLQVGSTADAAGPGSSESKLRTLDAGTYYVRVAGSLDDVQLYQLTLSAAPPAPRNLTWAGSLSAVWDVAATANFDNGGESDVFRNFDNVSFYDDASTTAVVVPANVTPGALLFNAATNYQFTGPGGITTDALTVAGGGTVELSNAGNALDAVNVMAGRLIISGDGNAAITGHVAVAAGSTLELVGAQPFADSSRLSGDGQVVGPVIMPGVVAPGENVGTLTFANNLNLLSSSGLEIDLGGMLQGLQYDLLDVKGEAALDGDLVVSLVNGFEPSAGDWFTILNAGSVAGAFANLDLPALNEGLLWSASYSADHLTLSVSTTVVFDPGDFNDDGQIDADDLAIWSAGFGLQGTAKHSQGDANGDHAVDGNDFLIWQRNMIVGSGMEANSISAPEPATWALVAAAPVIGASQRRRATTARRR
jgi:hypothetical protein